MRQLAPVLETEMTKVLKSKILPASILFFIFMGFMMGLLMFLSKHPEIAGKSAIMGTKVSMIGNTTWPSYMNLLIQIGLTVGCIGSGIVTIWVFGREFSDRVVKDLLVLPVHRYLYVISKYLVIITWSLILYLILLITGIIAGMIVSLDFWSVDVILENARIYFISGLLTIALCTFAGLITSMSRGYLLPITFVILTMMLTQFVMIAIPGISPFFPWAIPALYSHVAGPLAPPPGLTGYIVLFITSISCLAGTIAWWRYADQR